MSKIENNEPIKAEISRESYGRLVRARCVAADIYNHFGAGEAYFRPIPWLPEILDYLCKDIDVILHEIDEWELRDSQSGMRVAQETANN